MRPVTWCRTHHSSPSIFHNLKSSSASTPLVASPPVAARSLKMNTLSVIIPSHLSQSSQDTSPARKTRRKILKLQEPTSDTLRAHKSAAPLKRLPVAGWIVLLRTLRAHKSAAPLKWRSFSRSLRSAVACEIRLFAGSGGCITGGSPSSLRLATGRASSSPLAPPKAPHTVLA